jgi:hypothetical protein
LCRFFDFVDFSIKVVQSIQSQVIKNWKIKLIEKSAKSVQSAKSNQSKNRINRKIGTIGEIESIKKSAQSNQSKNRYNRINQLMSTQLDNVKQTARKVARRTLWLLLALAVVGSIGYYVYRTYTISEGSRTGTLFKISKKGVVFKTFEGQLHLAGSAMITTQSTWDFSVKNAAVYEQMQQYEGKNVKCHYKQVVDAFPWQGDTDYLVYKVEPVE